MRYIANANSGIHWKSLFVVSRTVGRQWRAEAAQTLPGKSGPLRKPAHIVRGFGRV